MPEKIKRSLDGVFVKNNTGGMVPINTLVTLKPTTGAEIVDRFNLFNASNLTVMAKPGYSTGQAMKAVEEVSENYFHKDIPRLQRNEP